MPSLSLYGRIARDWLEEHDPKEFQRLRKSGQLNAHLLKLQEKVSDQVYRVRLELLEKKPPPDDYLKAVQHHRWALSTAEELVLHDLFPALPPPDEREPAGPPAALIE